MGYRCAATVVSLTQSRLHVVPLPSCGVRCPDIIAGLPAPRSGELQWLGRVLTCGSQPNTAMRRALVVVAVLVCSASLVASNPATRGLVDGIRSPSQSVTVSPSVGTSPAAPTPPRTPERSRTPQPTPDPLRSSQRSPEPTHSPQRSPEASQSPPRTPEPTRSPARTPDGTRSPARTPEASRSAWPSWSGPVTLVPASLSASAVLGLTGFGVVTATGSSVGVVAQVRGAAWAVGVRECHCQVCPHCPPASGGWRSLLARWCAAVYAWLRA